MQSDRDDGRKVKGPGGRKPSDLRLRIESLNPGERITVNWRKTSPFSVLLAKIRFSTGKCYDYVPLDRESYEVWLNPGGTSLVSKRSFRYPKRGLNDDELDRLISARSEEWEWVYVLLVAHEAGIPAWYSRTCLGNSIDSNKNLLTFIPMRTERAIRRPMTPRIVAHIAHCPHTIIAASPICPTLAQLSLQDFADSWKRFRSRMKLPLEVALTALLRPWEKIHPDLLAQETAVACFAELELKWLKTSELKAIGLFADLLERRRPDAIRGSSGKQDPVTKDDQSGLEDFVRTHLSDCAELTLGETSHAATIAHPREKPPRPRKQIRVVGMASCAKRLNFRLRRDASAGEPALR